MTIELKKWFQVTITIVSLALTSACWLLVRSSAPIDSKAAQAGLALLAIAAVPGFHRLLLTLLPPVLTKLWPHLDRD